MPKTPTSLKVLLVLSAAGFSYCATWLLMQKLRRGSDKADSQDQAAESQDFLSSPIAACENCACQSEPPGPLEGTMEPYGRHVIICSCNTASNHVSAAVVASYLAQTTHTAYSMQTAS
eukprot:14111-Heterococcus_DN1.PRE.6